MLCTYKPQQLIMARRFQIGVNILIHRNGLLLQAHAEQLILLLQVPVRFQIDHQVLLHEPQQVFTRTYLPLRGQDEVLA